MSFKAIYTDKNGNREFIKIPGTPPLAQPLIIDVQQKSKEKTCDICRGKGVIPCTRCGGEGKHTEKRSGDKTTGAQHYSAHDKEEYSKADNKKIIRMKKENKAWKEILDAIGKQSKSQLQEHYKKNLQDRVDGQGNTGGNADVNAGNNTSGGFSSHSKEEYTKKNDKTITQMKQAGKDWKEILQAIGKESKSQLQAHWKNDLQPRLEQAGKGGSKGSNQGSARSDEDWARIAATHFQDYGTRIDIEEAKRLYSAD